MTATGASINTVTNGDAATVASTKYATLPRNDGPYFGIKLLTSADVQWTYDTDPEDAITISGKWAYSETAPAVIVHACMRLVAWLYRQKDTSADADRPLLTGDGNVIMPSAMPADVLAMLKPYRRLT